MQSLKIIECKGYTREEAFQDLLFNPYHEAIPGTNCTQAWNKAGRPMPGTKNFNIFAVEQLAEKTKNVSGLGLYIVVDAPTPNTRKRPYSVLNNVVDSTRLWQPMQYAIVESNIVMDDFPIIEENDEGELIKSGSFTEPSIAEYGKFIGIVDNKAEALQKIKDLICKTNKDYIALAIKTPDRNPVAIYGKYVPSANTKIGTYIAFGYNPD